MKRLFVYISVMFLIFQLSACSGDSEIAFVNQDYKTFSLAVPSDWRKITQENFANTIPEETVAVFLKKIEGDDFIQNANVIKESINTDASSLEYAKANIVLASKAIVDYRAISSEESEIGGISTVLHSFRARNSAIDPIRLYVQSYFVQDRVGYTVTCISKEDDMLQQNTCNDIIRSFLFK